MIGFLGERRDPADLGTRAVCVMADSKAANSPSADKKNGAEYAVEGTETFCLIVTVGSVAANANPWAPLAIAALLRAMVDAGRHLLGGQNPKVTLAVLAGHQLGWVVRSPTGWFSLARGYWPL
jgi:hypothetical protein